MIRPLFLSLCVGILASLSVPDVAAREALTTTWKGTLDAGGAKLRLEIDITADGGELTGELRSLDQGNSTLKATDIGVDGAELRFSVSQIGATFRGTIEQDGAVAEGTFSQNGMDFPLTLTKSEPRAVTVADSPVRASSGMLKEAWVGKLQMGVMEPVMQFRLVTLESGETVAFFDSVTEGRTGFDAEWSIEDGQLNFDVPEISLTYRGALNDGQDAAEGTWSQGGRELPLTLEKKATEYDTVNVWENRPQRPVEPFPYDAEDVTFENTIDGVTLAGTLTIPQESGRHPVAVLISGSGPQDRDESLMEHKPFLVLADYLSRRGIAVLRYDDRGTSESTGVFANATTEDFARDASAAMEFLKNHDRINSGEIGLVGHSEGGLIAPMVVGLRDDVAFVVLMAATGVVGKTISISQIEAMSRASSMEESDIEIEVAVSRAVLDAVTNAAPGEDFTDDVDEAVEAVIQTIPESEREEGGEAIRSAVRLQMKSLHGGWLRFFLTYDPRPALTAIRCPVLAIIGKKDLQVLPDLNMPEIRKALAGNEDAEFVELDGLNHLFQACETGALSEYATIMETFNPEALARIGDWIANRTTPSM